MFFYGGEWKTGSGSSPLYWGEHIDATMDETVVVTVNYRLNVFGFFGSELLRDEDYDGTTGSFRVLGWGAEGCVGLCS